MKKIMLVAALMCMVTPVWAMTEMEYETGSESENICSDECYGAVDVNVCEQLCKIALALEKIAEKK